MKSRIKKTEEIDRMAFFNSFELQTGMKRSVLARYLGVSTQLIYQIYIGNNRGTFQFWVTILEIYNEHVDSEEEKITIDVQTVYNFMQSV